MTPLPNPFESAAAHPATADEAAASPSAPVLDAAAELFDGPDIPLAKLVGRGFDVDGFLNDCEPLPAFLIAPSQQYLSATEIYPVLQTLAGH